MRTTPRVCVLLADGFEEIEAVTIVDVLRRAEVEVAIVGVESELAKGAHGIPVQTELTLTQAAQSAWDMLILPGGLPGATTLRDHPDVQSLLEHHSKANRNIAAICAAPIALGKAGLLQGQKATCYPGFEDGLLGATVVEDRVVDSGKVITSRGPGTAMEFALHLVGRLKGSDTAGTLRKKMLVD